MKPLGRPFLLFVSMATITVHFGTGLLASFTEKVPPAVAAMDTVLGVGLVSWLGHFGTLAFLAFLTVLLPILAYRQNLHEKRLAQPPHRIIKPARTQRMVGKAPKAGISPEDKKFVSELFMGAAEAVRRGREMAAANERPSLFVRLVPRVPIVSGVPARSWLGGNPSLPAGTSWPLCEGQPAAFLAQIDCSSLPPGLWEGAGPRTGWLSFFFGVENDRIVAKVLHTLDLGRPVEPPSAVGFQFFISHRTWETDVDWPIPKGTPQWPVNVVQVSRQEEDPWIWRYGASDKDDNPRSIRYRTGASLNDPGLKPFDWTTTLLMLDTAAAHARSCVKRSEKNLAGVQKALDRVSANPERYGDLDAARARIKSHALGDDRRASVWKACELKVRALRARVAEDAARLPFSEALLDDVIVELSTIELQRRDGEPAARAFRMERPPNSGLGYWLYSWESIAQSHAKHLYVSDPQMLPPAWRENLEVQAAFDSQREMGVMCEVPYGYVHEFMIGREVTLLELPTSDLLNWMWGDVDNLVLTIQKSDLVRNNFSIINAQITN